MSNIILIGFMGAGKTTAGLRLAKELGVSLIDTDQRIEEEQQRSINDIFAAEGEAYFRGLETQQLKKLMQQEQAVISVGGGLPVQRVNHPLLKQLGQTIYLKAQKETLVKRLQGSTPRPLLKGGQLEEKIASLMEAREAVYEEVADIIVETDDKNLNEVVEAIKEQIGSFRRKEIK